MEELYMPKMKLQQLGLIVFSSIFKNKLRLESCLIVKLIEVEMQGRSKQKIIFFVAIIAVVVCAYAEGAIQQDVDEDYTGLLQLNQGDQEVNIQDFKEDIVEHPQKLRPLFGQSDFEQVQKEVDHLIGIEEEEKDKQGHILHPADLTNLKKVLQNNKQWIKKKTQEDPEFFKKHQPSQKPTYLWIGCSDSRQPANEILGLDYGEVFVLRNVANMVSPSDISSLAVIQYAVEVLQVKDIIVAGHYGCGGIKAAVTKYDHGPLQAWLSKLRRLRHKHSSAFSHLSTIEEKTKLLVQINVKEQVFNVASTPFVQKAWKQGQELRVHGVVFEMQTGRLVDLHLTMHSIEQLPEQLAVFDK